MEVGADADEGAPADGVAEGGQNVGEHRNGIGLGVGLYGLKDVAEQTVAGFVGQNGPGRWFGNERSERNERSVAVRLTPAVCASGGRHYGLGAIYHLPKPPLEALRILH